MRSTREIVFVLALLAGVVLFPMLLSAQQSLGSIDGVVTDSSGAVVQGAQVTAVNSGTGLTRKTVSSGTGTYALQDLPVGTYALTVIRDGFDTQDYPAIAVQADRTASLNVQLKAGSVTTSVEVQATPLLNSTDTTNGDVLDSAQIQETPLGTGSFTQLALLSPGVNADFLSDTGTNTGLGNQNIWANGQRLSSNTFTMNSVLANNLFNGASSSQVSANRAVLNTGENFLSRGGTIQTNTSIYVAIGQALPSPPQETIQEIRVNTSMFDAQQGTTSGAHTDVTTMSGTNQLHGSLYGKLGNAALNAAPYFFNQDTSIPANQKVPDLHREIFGATLGAPIIKDKLFFFGSYQMTRVRDKLNSISSAYVPTGLSDDRSAAGLTNAANVYCAAAYNASSPASTPNCSAAGYSGSIDPIAAQVLAAKVGGQFFIPSFQSSTITAGNVNLFGPASTFDATQINGNLDYTISNRDTVSGKYYFQRDPTSTPFPSQSTSLLGFPAQYKVGSQVGSIENTFVFSPNLSWDQKIGFLRMNVQSTTAQPFDASTFGINVFGSPYFPGLSINDVTGGGNSLSIGPTSNFANTGFVQNTFEGTTNLNWVLGKHTLSFGGNGDFTQMNIINRANQVATIGFSNFADFLSGGPLRLGEANSVYFQGPSNRYYRAPQVGSYAQDKWRVLDNLTLSLGVRYDWDAGLYEKNGYLVNFDPSRYSYDLTSDTISDSGLVVAGNNKLYHTPGASNSTLTGRQWGFGPRVGLAWSPQQNGGNIVFRAGGGMYYDRGEFFTNFSPSAGSGFNGPFGVTLQPPFVQPVLATASGTLQNPFGTVLPPVDTNPADFINNLPNQAALTGGSGSPYLFGAYNARNKLPYSENWSLDMQWQARPDLAITVGYTGNHGVHQTVPLPFNQPQIATTNTPVNGQTYSYGYQVTDANGNAIPNEPFNTPTGGNTDLRVPYIGYSPNSVLWTAAGISHYNALLATVRKSFSNGLQGSVSYTFSHALDESSGYGLFYNGNDARNLRSGYASSDFDRSHVLTVNFVYELPKFQIDNRAASLLANGWGLVTISTLESGQPYNVYDFSGSIGSIYYSYNDYLTNPVLPLAPGVSPRQALTGHSGATLGVSAFNPNAFQLPLIPAGTSGVPLGDNTESGFGTGGRNIFRGDFQKRADFSFVKDTQFREHYAVRFSFDVFNITNTPSFDTPNNNVSTNYTFSAPPSNFNVATAFAQPSQQIGIIQHTLGSPRQVQFAAKLTF